MADSELSVLSLLACPHDGTSLHQERAWVCCPRGHRFPVVGSVPVLLRDDATHTIGIAPQSLRLARLFAEGSCSDAYFTESLGLSDDERRQVRAAIAANDDDVDPVISYLVGATNGVLYKHLIGSLSSYPIPTLPLPAARGERLLDVGCSWGRWSIAAGRRGYNPVGIDPSLGAVLAARRLCDRLGVPFLGVVGDARYLPFKPGVFDVAYSYSVLQHFSKSDARLALHQIRRTLRDGGAFTIQMASAWGLRSFQHQVMRRSREPTQFEIRYWSPPELRRTFRDIFGDANMSADCYFGLGLQASDLRIMPPAKRALIYGSELMKGAARLISPLAYLADSLFLGGRAVRPSAVC